MILNNEIVQKFVEQIINNLGYNVNIMDEEGIIIASGSNERIGKHHKIAATVIQRKETIVIDDDNADLFQGVKAGINIPFYCNNSLAGVVGITGNPKEIESLAQMVRMTVELMFEQAYLKEIMYLHQNKKVFFVNQLLSIDSEESKSEVAQWGNKLGYNLRKPRVVCLFSIEDILNKKNNEMYNKESIKNNIINIIKSSNHHSSEDITSTTSIDKIVVIKTIKKLTLQGIKEEISNYLMPIQKKINEEYKIKVQVGVGSYYNSLEQLKESFYEAKFLIEYASKIKSKNENFFIQDYLQEYFITKIGKKLLSHFFKEYLEMIGDNQEFLETIKILGKHNLNILETSKELFLHRNTIMVRFNKIKEMFNIDPVHNCYDRKFFELFSIYLEQI